MKNPLLPAALLLFAFASEADDVTDKFARAAAQGGPVITLDYRGNRMQRLTDAPTLSVFADGRVVMPAIHAHDRAHESRIDAHELDALLDFIVEQNDFFGPEEKRAGQPLLLPGHLATTEIRVYRDGQAKGARRFGLGHAASGDARLVAVHGRLEQLMSAIKLGGNDAVAAWLRVANDALRRRHPDARPLVAADLESGTRRNDGSTYVRFSRIDTNPPASASVTIALDASGQRAIDVTLDDLLPATGGQ